MMLDYVEKAQKIELYILIEFDKLCIKYGIKYSIFGGTLIGAARGGTFIPWDDDLDVCMLRSEYNKFIKHVDELPSDLFFQTNDTDPNYFRCAKIRYKKSKMLEREYLNVAMCHGVWIDILVLDHCPDDIGAYKKIIEKRNKIDHILCIKTFRQPGFKGKVHKMLVNILHPLSPRYYSNRIDKMYGKSNSDNINSNFLFYRFNSKVRYEADLFNDYSSIMFCGHNVMTIKNYDKMLKTRYGDYSVLPPIEERKPCHDIVDFEIYG